MLDSSKLKDFADDNFKFDENDRKFSKRVEEILWEKEELLVSFSQSVSRRFVLHTRKNEGLFGNGYNNFSTLMGESNTVVSAYTM